MIDSEFYRGVLDELTKLAYIPYPQPQPKPQPKKPFYKSPGFWAGMGGLGLAGLGAYKMMNHGTSQPANVKTKPITTMSVMTPMNHGTSQPANVNTQSTTQPDSAPAPTPSTPDTIEPSDTAGAISRVTGIGQAGSDLTASLGSISRDILPAIRDANLLSRLPGMDKLPKSIPGLSKIPVQGFSGAGNLLNGVSMISDSLSRGNDRPWYDKGMEGTTGSLATLDGLGAGTSLVSKVAPGLARSAGTVLGTGARFAGIPLTGAYYGGRLGQAAISHGTDMAEDHSDILRSVAGAGSSPQDQFGLANSVDFASHNPRGSDTYLQGLQNLYNIYNYPPAQQYVKQVTNPSMFARLGLGQYYHMPSWLGGKGYSQGQELGPLKHILEQTKERLNEELRESGYGPEIAKNETEKELQNYMSSIPQAYANNIPSMSWNRPWTAQQ